jgi:hypothetical protein
VVVVGISVGVDVVVLQSRRTTETKGSKPDKYYLRSGHMGNAPCDAWSPAAGGEGH